MKIRDFLSRRDAPPVEDPRAPRREVAQQVLAALRVAPGVRVPSLAFPITQQGPLGGEYEYIYVMVQTEFGPRGVRVCIYGNGVMAEETR